MGSKGKVRLDAELLRRARSVAEKAGYSSTEEFLEHLLGKELQKLEEATGQAADDKDLRERLKGLGYIS